MESMAMSFTNVLELVAKFGVLGLVMLMWWLDMRCMRRESDAFREMVQDILARYASDMGEQRRMYENNVDLVKRYAKMAEELTSVIHLNTQVQTQLVESIRSNMYCPMVREKKG